MSAAGEDEQLLERFRRWLREIDGAPRQPEAISGPGPAAGDDASPGVGLYRLVEEFTALRHEVKLQARSARGLEEQTAALLPLVREGVDALRSIGPQETQAAWAAAKPLALALAELDEALARGRGQLEKAGGRLLDDPAAALLEQLDELHARQPWFLRWCSASYHAQACELLATAPQRDRQRELFATLLEGYDLIQQRLRRGLAAEQIHEVATLGRPVDPNTMVVVDVVESPDCAEGVVVEELRKGYTWRGRLLRCAEVRASSGRPNRPAS